MSDIGDKKASIEHVVSISDPDTDRAAVLSACRVADPGPGWGDFRMWKYMAIVLVSCLSSGDNGFDGTIVSSVNSMVQFQKYFSLGDEGVSGQSLLFGIFTIGSVVGFIPGSIIPDRYGRRWGQFLGNVLIIVGALLNGFAKNMGTLLAGRFLLGVGGTLCSVAAKAYLAEISSPWSRGLALGVQNSFWYVGNILASGIAIPFGRHDSDWAWRAPLLLQMALAVPNVALILLCPESPRWLYTNGRKDEAVRVLADLTSRDNDTASPLVQLQIHEIEDSISVSGAEKTWYDFRPLVRTASDRYRWGLCVLVACWGQLSGNGMVSYFMPTLLKQAGISSPDRQRVLTFASTIVSMAGALTGACIIDHVGRRPLMLGSEIWAAVGLAIVAGIGQPNGRQSVTRSNAGIAMIMLWSVLFSVGWTPLQGLYPAEVLSYEMRAKGLALQALCSNAFSCINTFGLPPALKALSWKMYMVFMCWDIVGVVVIWIWVVETKQLSLEELDEVFEAKSPKHKAAELCREAKIRLKLEKENTQA